MRLSFRDDFRLKHTIYLQQVKKRQDDSFILQVLFRGVESLDFLADVVIHGINFGLVQIRMNSAVQENESINFGHRGMTAQPLTVLSRWAERLALLHEARRMTRHPF